MNVRIVGLDRLTRRISSIRASLPQKKRRFLEELAKVGIDTATVTFASAQYDGDNDVVVNPSPEWVDENRLFVTASGDALLFIEFGSGVGGYGHPLAQGLGFGPGTWSDDESKGGKHHWQNPNGWYYQHGRKSHGNPPARGMYEASKEMQQRVIEIAREVFCGD